MSESLPENNVPSVVDSDQRDITIQTILDLMHGRVSMNPNRNRSERTLTQYSTDLLLRIREALDTRAISFMTMKMLVRDDLPESSMSQNLWFMRKLSKGDNIFSEYSSAGMINALRKYDELPRYEDYSLAPAKVRNQCIVIIKVLNTLLDYADKNYRPVVSDDAMMLPDQWISDNRLVALLLDNPRNANQVIKLVREHRRGDFGFLDAMINGGNIPLSSGVL